MPQINLVLILLLHELLVPAFQVDGQGEVISTKYIILVLTILFILLIFINILQETNVCLLNGQEPSNRHRVFFVKSFLLYLTKYYADFFLDILFQRFWNYLD